MNNQHHNNGQRDYFHSADQPTIQPVESPYVLRHRDRLVSCGGLERGQNILEVGAGVGRFSQLLAAQGLVITASDISPELITALKQNLPGIPAFVDDVNDLTTRQDIAYDAVVGFFMLHHLPDLTRAFKSMAARLKPGGKIVFCEPNAWFLPFYLQILLSPRMRWSIDKGVMNMRAGLLTPALRNNGFNNIEYTGYGFLPPRMYNSSWGARLDQNLGKLALPTRAHAFQIITASYEN
jgi:2-polyprenyl-3-methyl-5-hydroxy-6-metoxy-1,4-benzoquinol methylase